MPISGERFSPSCLAVIISVSQPASVQVRDSEHATIKKFMPQGRSSVVEQRPFKPKVVGSIPTAPTNISFLDNRLQLFEGPRGAINVRLLAPAKPSEPLCCSPLAMHWELPACRYSWSFEYLHVAAALVAPLDRHRAHE